MIKFEFDGKPFDAKSFKDKITKKLMEATAEQLHKKVGSIRHPQTGEFPTVVVSATSLENISLRVEGSPELLELVNQRLGVSEEKDVDDMSDDTSNHKVFLSYTWDDSELAKKIAEALMANGIDTWWDKWCIGAGDSFRQKIDEGLDDCTHFLVLLTPNSLNKPWVNQEMDAGLMRKLQAKSKFIPIRHMISASQLPPLLSGMYAPEISEPESDIQQLINDIRGVTKKPPLGKPLEVIAGNQKSKYSDAANAVARVFVERTTHALEFDPQIPIAKLIELTQLTEDDVNDAIHELSEFVSTLNWTNIAYPKSKLFATFDHLWMPWNPADDALKLATDMVNDSEFPSDPESISEKYQWDRRRLNPAIVYLENRKLIDSFNSISNGNWASIRITKTDNTRRFVKSRS